MSKDVSKSFESYFGDLTDPRIERTKLYPLSEILFVVLTGSVCGAESWRDYVLFGEERLEFLQEYYPFESGVPSKNTFFRVFSALDVEAFKTCFIEWVKSLQVLLNEVIAIDGKTLCNSFDKASAGKAIHMVSAFATGARLVLAQQKVDGKSNEITAIPKVLSLLDLKGHIVTIDAMGTQKAVAKQIASAVPSHWMIENCLYWTLYAVFNEDKSRIRKDKAGENMALIRHITINMLNNAKKHIKNIGIKALRKKAGWGNKTLSFILGQNF